MRPVTTARSATGDDAKLGKVPRPTCGTIPTLHVSQLDTQFRGNGFEPWIACILAARKKKRQRHPWAGRVICGLVGLASPGRSRQMNGEQTRDMVRETGSSAA